MVRRQDRNMVCGRKRNLRGYSNDTATDILAPEPHFDFDDSTSAAVQHRRLGNGTQVIDRPYYKGPYFTRKFYQDTGTEYYFRYQGSVIEPPCLE